MKRIYVLSMLTVMLLGSSAGAALAHGTGISYEEDVGEYRVDIGYDPEVFTAGERILLDISLFTQGTTDERAAYDSVWVRVTEGRQTYLATGVHHAQTGPSTVLLVLPESVGEQVEVHARFERSGETLADVSFPISVNPPRGSLEVLPWLLLLLGMIAGCGIGYATGRTLVRV